MSLEAMVMVIERCPEKGGEYNVLHALANRAAPDGRNVWFTLEQMAFEARMGVKNLEICLRKLLDKGRLSVEPGKAPHGYDLWHIVFPARKLDRGHWEKLTQQRVERKRAEGKTLLGKKRAPRARREKFSQAAPPASPSLFLPPVEKFSDIGEKFSRFAEKFSRKTPAGAALGGGISFSNSSFNSPFNSLVTHLECNARAGTLEGAVTISEVPLLPERVTGFFLEDEKNPLTLEGEAGTEAPSAAPGGAGSALLEQLMAEIQLGRLEPETGKALEEVAPGAAAGELPGDEFFEGLDLDAGSPQDAEPDVDPPEAPSAFVLPRLRPPGVTARPGMPVYDKLVILMGGPKSAPQLLTLLAERENLQGEQLRREDWLRLTEDELGLAVDVARAKAKSGEGHFRTLLIASLDQFVLHGYLPAVDKPLRPQAPAIDTHLPGQGTAGPAPSPWTVGQRVTLEGRLGVVLSVSKDVTGAVTVELDDGAREGLVRCDFHRLAPAPEGAPPPPTPASPYDVGQRWVPKAGGEPLTVTARDGVQSVTLSNDQTYSILTLHKGFRALGPAAPNVSITSQALNA